VLVGVGPTEDFECTEIDNHRSLDSNVPVAVAGYLRSRFPAGPDVRYSKSSWWAGYRPMSKTLRCGLVLRGGDSRMYHCFGLSAFGISHAPALAEDLANLVLGLHQPK
jgi:glycine/D-amino acid oxidase-like deaminating enzyme